MQRKAETENKNLTSNVVEFFRQQYLSGSIQPGQVLPSERDLAAQLDVSRTTIREGIIGLKVMGLIEIKQGKRAVVTAPSLDNVIQILSLITPLNQTSCLNLLELREIFEPPCVSLATKRMTPVELRLIKLSFDAMAQSIHEPTAFFKADYEFHRSIMVATHNEMIVTFYNIFRPLLENLAKTLVETSEDESVHEKEAADHERVLQAIGKGDAELASSLTRDIILNSRDRFLRLMLDKAD